MGKIELFRYKGREFKLIQQECKFLRKRKFVRVDHKLNTIVFISPDVEIKEIRHRIINLKRAIKVEKSSKQLSVWYEMKDSVKYMAQ